MGRTRPCYRCGRRMVLVVTSGDKYWECTNERCMNRQDVR